jgi:tetratricopeptide (TPR) repeat protein
MSTEKSAGAPALGHPVLEEATRLERSGDFAGSLAQIAPLAESARASADVLWASELSLRESRLLTLTGDAEQALLRVDWVMVRASAPEHREVFAQEKAARTVAMSFLLFANAAKDELRMSFQETLGVLAEADRFLEQVNRLEWKAGVCSERAGIYERMGRWQEAVEEGRLAIELKLRCPSAPSHALGAMQRSLARRLQHVGQAEEAKQLLLSLRQTEVYSVLEQLGVECELGHLALQLGDLELAEPAAARALALSEGMGANQRIAAAGLAVEVFLALQRLPEASSAAKEVRAAASQLGSSAALFAAAQDEFDVAFARGEAARAKELLAEMETHAQALAVRGNASPQGQVELRRVKLAAAHD